MLSNLLVGTTSDAFAMFGVALTSGSSWETPRFGGAERAGAMMAIALLNQSYAQSSSTHNHFRSVLSRTREWYGLEM